METKHKTATGKPSDPRENNAESKAIFHESERHLLDVMSNMRMIAVMLDSKGRITFCNDHFLKITGWEREEALGADWFDSFIRDADKNVYQIFKNALDNEDLLGNYENAIFTKSGAQRLVSWNNTLLRDKDGRVIGTASIGEDITEKKQALEALRKSDERVQVFFNQSLDGFFFCQFDKPRPWKNAENKDEILADIIDTQRFTDVNDAMLKQYGVSREKFLSLTTKDIFAHDLEQGRKLRRELFDNGRLHLETYERTTDGAPVWFEGDYVCSYDPEGGIIGFFGIQREITDRKQAELAMRESEERYRALFTGILDGVYRSTHAGRFIDVNPAMIEMFGYTSREEMLEIDIKKDLYFAPGERESLFIDTDMEKVDIFHMKRKDGSEIWVEDRGKYIHDEHGNVIFHEGTLRNVTERIHTEEARRSAEEKYHGIFENAVEGIYQSSAEGKFLTVNPAFARMLGYDSPEEMIASITDIAHQVYYDETPRRAEFIKTLEKDGSISGFEYQMLRKDKRLIWVSENARIVRNAKGKTLYYEGIVEDITARKKNERHMDTQLKRLNALHSIDNAINSSTNLRTTLDVLLKEVIVQLKADAVSVLLFNTSTLTLDYIASRGFKSRTKQRVKLGAGQGFAGRVIMDRKTVHIPNLAKSESKLLESLSLTGEKFTDYVGVPLVAKGQIVGVMEIFQRSPLAADRDWFDFLDMLVGQTAIAVDNGQMFENLQRSNFELTLAYDATIEGWSRALDLRDKETEGHTQRVTALTMQLSKQMGISDSEILHIRRGALLHDIGKMGIPDNILLKPDQLTDEEWKIMRRHTIYANEMLSPITYLRPALDIPRHHHEKWDGTGYPQGLKNTEIPLPARIFAVVDVWDAVTSDRPYRAAWSKEKAMSFIKNELGKHFDPDVVKAFLRLMEK